MTRRAASSSHQRPVLVSTLLGFALRRGGRRALAVRVDVGRPDGEVVAQQLHDERGVLVVLLGHLVELRHRLVERRLRHLTGAIRQLQHLVVEHLRAPVTNDELCAVCTLNREQLTILYTVAVTEAEDQTERAVWVQKYE